MSTRPPPRSSFPPDRTSASRLRSAARLTARPAPASSVWPAASDYELASAARRVVEGALGVVPGETLVVVVGPERADVGQALRETAISLGAKVVVYDLEAQAGRALRTVPTELDAALRSAQASVLVSRGDEREAGFRRDMLGLVRACGLRHAHMVGVSRRAIIAGLSADASRIVNVARAVRMRLRPESVLRLRSAAGSDLEIRLDATCRWVERVGAIRAGRWENLPAGVLVTTPRDVQGVFVADASIGGTVAGDSGALATKAVRFEIEGGACRSVRSVDASLQRAVEASLRREHGAARVGTVTLGTNVGLNAPLGEVVVDLGLPGLHLGFGDGHPDDAGGMPSALSQLSATGSSADVDLDGVALLRAGRYLVM